MPKPIYSGVLNTPIGPRPERSGLSAMFTGKDRELEIWKLKAGKRIDALCAYYEVEWNGKDTNWFALALALALHHVPGFFISQVGAPRTRSTAEGLMARRQLLTLLEAEKRLLADRNEKEPEFSVLSRLLRRKSKLPSFYRKKKRLSLALLKSDISMARRERTEFKGDMKAMMSLQ